MFRNKYSETLFYFFLIVLVWAVVIAIVGITGEFPFGDDFAYAGPVKKFSETGILHMTDWSSMTLVLQMLIGGAVVKVFGFSFAILRVISLVGGLSATIAIFFFLRFLLWKTEGPYSGLWSIMNTGKGSFFRAISLVSIETFFGIKLLSM